MTEFIMLNKQSHHNYKPYLKPLARHLRKNATLSEVLLWNNIKNRALLGYKFRRQAPILNYIVDFYCPELKLAIEIDGSTHDVKIEYDLERQKKLEGTGIFILRFQDVDVKKDVNGALQAIVDWVNGHAATSPTPTPPKRGLLPRTRPIHLAILGSTRGTNLQAIIEAIAEKKLDAVIDVVVSNKADSFILERAKARNIPTLCLDSTGKTREHYDRELLTAVQEYPIDLILLIGYMRILSPTFVRAYKNKILNVHPSLLPAFAGGMDMNVHEEVLKSGVKETGCTIHLVDEGVDTGKILLQKKCKVETDDTVETLKAKVQRLEGEAWVEVLNNYQPKADPPWADKL